MGSMEHAKENEEISVQENGVGGEEDDETVIPKTKKLKRRRIEPKGVRQNIITIAVIILISCLLAVVIELSFSMETIFLDANTPEINKLDFSQAKITNAVLESDGARITGKDAQIQFDIKKQYVDRLAIEFSETNRFDAKITLDKYSDFGKLEKKEIEFKYNSQTNRGTKNIRGEISNITIDIPDAENAYFGSLTLNNTFQFDVFRFGFLAAAIFLIFMFVVYYKLLAKKIHLAFLLVSLVGGIVMIVAVPSNGASWDEETHFRNVYTMAVPDDNVVTQSKFEILGSQFLFTYSLDDKKDMIHHVNAYDTAEHIVPDYVMTKASPLTKVGYVTQALFIAIGHAIGAPLYVLLLMGRFGNLLIYCIVSAFAIKYIKKGKMLMFVVAMIPTSLFIATTFAYDPTVTSFMLLAFAIICNEFLEPEKALKIQSLIGFILCTVIASCPKAVYIPFVLVFLFLPSTKFKSRRSMLMMKGIIALVFLLMMSTFMLPMLLGGVEGDARGGDTSTTGQLISIFTHPFSYAKLLITSIFNTFTSYFFDGGSTTFFAYLGMSSTKVLAAALLIAVSFTDTNSYCGESELIYPKRIRIGTIITVSMIIVLIWTALYLSFTPVGISGINGVQNRYYLPFFVPVLMLLNSNKIKNSFNPMKYRIVIEICSSYILFKTIYDLMIKPAMF